MTPAGTASALIVTDLRVRGFGGFVLGPLSFVVPDGAFVCILGRAGAGKSLLLSALAGLVWADGTIEHAGPVSMQFQRDALVDDESVFDNVARACIARGVPDATSRTHAALESVGLTDRADALPRRLSGGQRRRAGLARALAVMPAEPSVSASALLLLDDPTAGLDPRTAGDVAAAFGARPGRIVLCATHDVDGLARSASHVLLLEDGRVTRFGAPDPASLPPALSAFAPRADAAPVMW